MPMHRIFSGAASGGNSSTSVSGTSGRTPSGAALAWSRALARNTSLRHWKRCRRGRRSTIPSPTTAPKLGRPRNAKLARRIQSFPTFASEVLEAPASTVNDDLPRPIAREKVGGARKMKALFLDCNDQLAPVWQRVVRPDDPSIAVNRQAYSQAELPRVLKGYDICIDDHSYLPTELVDRCDALKHVVFLGTGPASYMSLSDLAARGIKVHTIRNYGDTAVAEHTIALMFAACREVARMDREVRAGTWVPHEGVQLLGKTLGVIGLGGIGTEVLRIGRAIGMEVIAWNRSPRPGAPLVALEELLARSDVISMNLTLNDETRSFLGAGEFARMKPGAIFVNTARAALVDEAAFIAALRTGRIRHAGLDVFHAEPLSPDNPLGRMENVTLTAHAAFRTIEASMTLLRRAIDIVRDIVAKPT